MKSTIQRVASEAFFDSLISMRNMLDENIRDWERERARAARKEGKTMRLCDIGMAARKAASLLEVRKSIDLLSQPSGRVFIADGNLCSSDCYSAEDETRIPARDRVEINSFVGPVQLREAIMPMLLQRRGELEHELLSLGIDPTE